MEKQCRVHAGLPADKPKSLDAGASKHKTKSAAKEEAKQAKSEQQNGLASPTKSKSGEAGAKAGKSDKEKKLKKEEDKKNGIRKPLSAYMLYCNHRRPIIMNESPGKSLEASHPF
jgi:hypothetical protein